MSPFGSTTTRAGWATTPKRAKTIPGSSLICGNDNVYLSTNPWNEASSPVHATPTKSTLPAHCCAAASTEGASALQTLQVGAQNQNAVERPARSAPLNSPPPTRGAVNCNNSGTLADPAAAPAAMVVSLAADDAPPHEAIEMSKTTPVSARPTAPETARVRSGDALTELVTHPLSTEREVTTDQESTCFPKVFTSPCRASEVRTTVLNSGRARSRIQRAAVASTRHRRERRWSRCKLDDPDRHDDDRMGVRYSSTSPTVRGSDSRPLAMLLAHGMEEQPPRARLLVCRHSTSRLTSKNQACTFCSS